MSKNEKEILRDFPNFGLVFQLSELLGFAIKIHCLVSNSFELKNNLFPFKIVEVASLIT